MLMDDLASAFETLKERIRTHGATLRANETRTRMALIDPLLTALGWDVSDPALVTPEYTVGGGRADYALHGSEAIPSAIVEAKRLGHALDDDERMQMLNYANARGVRYAAVTDGDVWEFYEVFKQAPLEDRRLLSLRVANTPAHALALQLMLLWRPNLASGQPAAVSEPLIGWEPEMQSITPELAPPVASDVIEYPRPRLVSSPAISAGWANLAEYDPPSRSDPPQSIRFPDGKVEEIRRWNDILVAVATWLNSTNRLTAANTPVESSARIYIIHDQPVHPTGNRFFLHQTIAEGRLAVNTHGSAVQMRNNAKKLLQHCGVNPDTVQLQVD